MPHIGQQLQKIARGGKVAITAVCVAAVCALNFASPSAAADLSALSSDAELINSGDGSSIFAQHGGLVEKSTRARRKVSFEHWLATGLYHDSGSNLGTVRYGLKAKAGSFTAYLTAAFRYDLDIDGIDDIPIKTRTYSGLQGLLIDNGEGRISYGYTSTKAATSKHLRIRSTQHYLLHYRTGSLQITGLGYEYFDTEGKKVSGDEGADNVRSHGVALYRAGINYPLVPLFTDSDAIAIDLKLSSALHLGDIGWVKLGESWQGELNEQVGEEADLNHRLYHRAAGSLKFKLADQRISVSLGGEIHNTIGGNIELADAEDGSFDIRYTILSIAGVVDLLPSQDISLSGSFGRYEQAVTASFGGEEYERNNWGTSGRFVIKKDF